MANKVYSPHGGMIHCNGNLLCAIDVETTGVKAGFNELVQLAILPLDSNIKPYKGVTPFYLNITPQYIDRIDYQALKVTRKTLTDLINNSMDTYRAQDLFVSWFERLNLPLTANHHKKLMPLWSNGGFDKSFLIAWLGQEAYNNYFHFHERDTQTLALAINDRFCHHAEKIPFPKVGLNYLASCFNIVNETAHDALSDCVTTAEVYRRLLLMWQPVNPAAEKADGPEVDYSFGKKK